MNADFTFSQHRLIEQSNKRKDGKSTGNNNLIYQRTLECFSESLQTFQKYLHLPEELALRFADWEREIFLKANPIDYVRYVSFFSPSCIWPSQSSLNSPNEMSSSKRESKSSSRHPAEDKQRDYHIQSLVNHFQEVSKPFHRQQVVNVSMAISLILLACILLFRSVDGSLISSSVNRITRIAKLFSRV